VNKPILQVDSNPSKITQITYLALESTLSKVLVQNVYFPTKDLEDYKNDAGRLRSCIVHLDLG